ncbi:MAG: hypothetical protein EP335_08390 [Alphaproteobacteria bacterium]|nr:MAG: hypothetical protein EP335_08390 [Alphaproteobacteria bacterium]
MVRRLRTLFALACCLMGAQAPAQAWDENTHNHIADRALQLVEEPAFRDWLAAHRDALLAGEAFPDWGHGIKPHGDILHAAFISDLRAYVQRDDRQAEPGFDDLFAFYLGAVAHVAQDRLLDASFKLHAAEVGEAGRDDMENGVIGPLVYGYLTQARGRYRPDADLARIYAAAGYYGENRLNTVSLGPVMDRVMARGEVQQRQLKLLSFLGGDYLANRYRWGAANMGSAPGGLEACARATAALWQALWAEREGGQGPTIVFSAPGQGEVMATGRYTAAYGKIVLITGHRVELSALDADAIRLTGPDGPVPFVLHPYIDDGEHANDLAFLLEPAMDLVPGGRYGLAIPSRTFGQIAAGADYSISFTVAASPAPDILAEPLLHWRLGLFLSVLLAGLAGLLFGAPDIVRLLATGRSGTMPLWGRVPDVAFKLAGVALLGVGFWMLATDGSAFIEFLRHHH